MSKQYLDKDGLQVIASKVNKKISTVTEMPQNASDGQVVVYVGETSSSWIKGHVYKFDAAKTINLTAQTSDSETVGYILYTKVSDMPVTSNGWIFKSTDDEDKLTELIQGNYQFNVDSVGDNFNFRIYPEYDPMIIGASYNALHISYIDGITPSQQELTFGITYGNDWWIDITEDGSKAAADAMNSIAKTKNDLFQYEYLPNAKGSFLNKIIQELQDGYFYKCNPIGEEINVTTENQFKSYLSSYGETIDVVVEPYASETGSVLIDGYQYFVNNVTGGSRVMKTQTNVFLTRINVFDFSQPCEIVSVEEIQDLDLSMYSDFEWEQIAMPDEEARETAAGAIGLAQQAIENSSDVYSVNEVKTNKIWFNGKPIYRKVLTLSSTVDNITQNTLKNISSNLVETTSDILALNINDITTIMKLGNNTTGYTFSLNSSNGVVSVVSNNENNTSLSEGFHILLEYTKTTN